MTSKASDGANERHEGIVRDGHSKSPPVAGEWREALIEAVHLSQDKVAPVFAASGDGALTAQQAEDIAGALQEALSASPAPIGPTREDVARGIRRADQEYVATYGIPESTDDDRAWAEFIAAAILDLRTTREDAPAPAPSVTKEEVEAALRPLAVKLDSTTEVVNLQRALLAVEILFAQRPESGEAEASRLRSDLRAAELFIDTQAALRAASPSPATSDGVEAGSWSR